MNYHLISHPLCPFVQRVAITLREKNLPFERTDIDLSNKPGWFLALSPTGKTPLLKVDQEVIFESAVICEYLEQEHGPAMLASAALARAKQRSWIEFASACLQKIAHFYRADETQFSARQSELIAAFRQLDANLNLGPYFCGEQFSLVDAAFAPVFRYLPLLEQIAKTNLTPGFTRLHAWQQALTERASVQAAAPADYTQRLHEFICQVRSHLGDLARAQL